MSTEIDKEIDEFRNLAIKLFLKSNEHKAGVLGQSAANIGAMLALIAPNESTLLDGIDMAHKQIHQHAAETFVKVQKLIKESKDWK